MGSEKYYGDEVAGSRSVRSIPLRDGTGDRSHRSELYFSSLLFSDPAYVPAAERLFDALDARGVSYRLLERTKDIWLRDFMPARTKSGKYISFRYEPMYLAEDPERRTDFRRDISPLLTIPVSYSNVNLDGGNIVFSPSRETAVISDRIFPKNGALSPTKLIAEPERTPEANVVVIPSLRSDMTGHADGMARFLSENVALVNAPLSSAGLEARVKRTLRDNGIQTVDFPWVCSGKNGAVGCYFNFLDTPETLFPPIFGLGADREAIAEAEALFSKPVVPVFIPEIAAYGGCLNCIA